MASTEKNVGLILVIALKVFHDILSFLVFCCLDLLDAFLCYFFKLADFFVEHEWKPCYCSSGEDALMSSGKILVSERGQSKIVSISGTELRLEDISDTLYWRNSIVSEIKSSTATRVKELKKLKVVSASTVASHERLRNGTVRSKFRINSAIVEMLQGKFGRQMAHPVPRWSDCHCHKCISWRTSHKQALFVRADGLRESKKGQEIVDVLFIHGFVSSSVFWSETLFPNFSDAAKSKYRFLAVDLLGFGRSPKPTDSLYTLSEHVDMIKRTVLDAYGVKSLHIVAHSLGCIIAVALAVKYPNTVNSLTLLSPPYFPVPKGENGSQYVLRQVAPRRVWPLMAFGSSVASWYEHISRMWCLMVSKNHRLLDFMVRQLTRNRVRTYMVEGFFCHTHHAAWHTLHNIIFGSASKMDGYLEAVGQQLDCKVTIFHGSDDELLPLECSYAVRAKIPRSIVKVVDKKDHLTIVIGRQKAFARELEEIWKTSE